MKNLFHLSLLFVAVLSFGQERTVSGNVTFLENGLPLPGVSIIIDKTNKGTQTDLDGNYSIIANPNDILVFSFVEMETQRIKADKTKINVELEEDDARMETLPIIKYPSHYNSYPVPVRSKKTSKTSVVIDKNPKSAFRKNAKNNEYIIFASELTSYIFTEEEKEFQQKYNVRYMFTTGDFYRMEYKEKYNKLTFKHLNKKYNKSWQTEIRKDAIGLDDFLK